MFMDSNTKLLNLESTKIYKKIEIRAEIKEYLLASAKLSKIHMN